jgi:hypothetical protein
MHRLSALFAAALALILAAAQAWATTYTLSNATYTSRFGVYSATTGATGSFTTAAPLPAGLNLAPIASGTGGLGYVTSWSFSDGLHTFTEANSGPLSNEGLFFSVSTDGVGAITEIHIYLTSPLFLTASKLVNRFDLTALPGNGSTLVGIYSCPGGTVGGLCGTYYGTADHAQSATAPVLTASGSPPATVTLVKPAANKVIAQNTLGNSCPSDPTRGSGYRINFKWKYSKPPNFNHFHLHVQRMGSPATVDVDLATKTFKLNACNSVVIDSDLANWDWQVTAFDNSGAVLATSAPGPFSFAPCRLPNGAACAP